MQVLRKCQICGLRVAKYGCNHCGKNACETCFDLSNGICISCKQGKKIK